MSEKKCDHEWSDEYVCSLCGAILYGSAPMWAVCTKMTSGPRQVWLALWTFADRDTDRPDPIWPGNAAISLRCGGISESTLQGHLKTLSASGWIAIRGEGRARKIALAWMRPNPPDIRDPEPPGYSDEPPEKSCEPPGYSGTLNPPDIRTNPPKNHANPPDIRAEPPENPDHTLETPFPDLAETIQLARVRDAQAAHSAIVEQQQRLATERAENRKRAAADDPRILLPGEHRGAVVGAGALWARELDRGDCKWVKHLLDAITTLALTPDQVSAVLAAWDRQAAELGGPLEVAKLDRFKGPMPPREGIWWPSWRSWVARQISPGGGERDPGNARSETPLSCAWPKGVPKVVSFTEKRLRKQGAGRS